MGKKYIKGGNIYKEVGEFFMHSRHHSDENYRKPLRTLRFNQCRVVTTTKIIVIN